MARGQHGGQGRGPAPQPDPLGAAPAHTGLSGTMAEALGSPTLGQFQTQIQPEEDPEEGPSLRSGSRAPRASHGNSTSQAADQEPRRPGWTERRTSLCPQPPKSTCNGYLFQRKLAFAVTQQSR